uniref:Putative myosin light chain kinase n=1 Tax=Ixodes ricinus TaxID=34613 RepID=A0A147BGB8_IXORI
MMSPNVPLLMQVCTLCLLIASGQTSSSSLIGYHADIAHLQLLHVANIYSAPFTGTMTSKELQEAAPPLPIKETQAAAGVSGHGNPAVMMSPNVPLLMQVGDRKHVFHSDYLCLIVLPCPHTIAACVRDCFSVAGLLLILAGDVEENPGPITQEMFNDMIRTQKEILAKITEVQVKQTSSEESMLQMQNRLLAIEKKLESVRETENRLAKLENFVSGYDVEMNTLVKQIDDLENRSRRNNLIVRGIKEEASENEDVLMRKINNEVFDTILNQKLNSIQRIHRLGKKMTGRDRPVILTVADFKEKMAIMKNCVKLKGTKISINEDYSKRVVELRKNLWNSTAEERKNGAKVNLVFDKLWLNNVLYAWNEVSNERYKRRVPPEANNE